MSNRRDYFKKTLGDLFSTADVCVKEAAGIQNNLQDIAAEVLGIDDRVMDTFFDSYENSYSLTLAYPRDMFEQMAEKAGIPHEGRDTLAIAEDLHAKGVI